MGTGRSKRRPAAQLICTALTVPYVYVCLTLVRFTASAVTSWATLYTMESSSAIKQNEILASVTTGMDLQRVLCQVEEVRERKTPYEFTHM